MLAPVPGVLSMDKQLINVSKLHEELKLAGLPVISVSSTGVILYSRDLSTKEKSKAETVILAHDPELPIQVTTDKMILALWKKVMSGDSSEADSLQQILDKT